MYNAQYQLLSSGQPWKIGIRTGHPTIPMISVHREILTKLTKIALKKNDGSKKYEKIEKKLKLFLWLNITQGL